MRRLRHGNLAHLKANIGNVRSHKEPVNAQVLSCSQNTQTGFYQVNCQDVRRGQTWANVPVAGYLTPQKGAMGLLVFGDGSVDLPFFLPLGW